MKRNVPSLITLFILAYSLQAFQPAAQSRLTQTESVAFIGMEKEHLVFEVFFNDEFQKGSVLTISDESGREIYSEPIKMNVSSRRYRIDRNLASKLQFRIKCKKVVMNTSFNVNYMLEEKWEITKA